MVDGITRHAPLFRSIEPLLHEHLRRSELDRLVHAVPPFSLIQRLGGPKCWGAPIEEDDGRQLAASVSGTVRTGMPGHRGGIADQGSVINGELPLRVAERVEELAARVLD
jgi:hypothetical protein